MSNFPARTRIQAAATQNGWTADETIMNGPKAVIDVFSRINATGGTDVFTVEFDNGRFTGGTRHNDVPADQGGANDTFWRRMGRAASIAAHESSRTPKGRVERIIAAFV
jgi:hypothetical protein